MEPQASGAITETVQTAGEDDRVTSYGWKALAGSVIGYSMNGFDNSRAGSLVTWTLMGAVLGGFIFGTLSDHFGRIRVLTWTILIFAVFTGLCAFARGYWQLVACRVAGPGLGGEFGIGMTLATEAWPASKRARASSYVSLGWQSGVLMAALVTPMLLPIIGWRGMFLVGLLPALVAFIVRRTLHEPEIFVKKHAAQERELVSLAGALLVVE